LQTQYSVPVACLMILGHINFNALAPYLSSEHVPADLLVNVKEGLAVLEGVADQLYRRGVSAASRVRRVVRERTCLSRASMMGLARAHAAARMLLARRVNFILR